MQTGREDDHRAAGFRGQVGFGSKPALVVVDLMMAYFDTASPMYAHVEGVLDACLRLMDVARSSDVPVIATRQVYEGHEGVMYARKVPALQLLGPGSALAELHPSVREREPEILVKHYPSAFHRTGLADRLRTLGVDTALVVGLTTSGCIRATAMDCLLHDLHGIVVAEAVGDRDAATHGSNLIDIGNKLADVVDAASVAGWIGSCATRDRDSTR